MSGWCVGVVELSKGCGQERSSCLRPVATAADTPLENVQEPCYIHRVIYGFASRRGATDNAAFGGSYGERSDGIAMESAERVRQVEEALNNLVVARKCIQVYPSNNPSIGQALDKLILSLSAFFSPGPAPAEPLSELSLHIERDVLYWGGEEIATKNDAVRKFAREMYRNGVSAMSFSPGGTSDELREFLQAASTRPGEPGKTQDLVETITALGFEHVRVEGAELLDLHESDKPPDESDMLDYIRRKHGSGQGTHGGGGEAGVVAAEGDGDLVEASDLVDFFLDIADGSQEARERLFRTLDNPGRIAETLERIAHSDARQRHRQGDDASLTMLQDTLKHIADSLRTLPADAREAYVQNVGKALAREDNAELAKEASTALLANPLAGDLEEQILGSFSDTDVAQILTSSVRFHEGTEKTITNFLEDFTKDPSRRHVITQIVAHKLSEAGDERLVAVSRELAVSSAPPPPVGAEAALKRDAQYVPLKAYEKLVRELAFAESELIELSGNVESDAREVSLPHALQAMLNTYAYEVVEDIPHTSLSILDDLLANALKQERHALVVSAVTWAEEELPEAAREQMRKDLTATVEEFCSSERLERTIGLLRRASKNSPEYAQFLRVSRFFGEGLAEGLLAKLVDEDNRSTRLFLTGMMADIGETCVPALLRNVTHPAWYVVRNVVNVLGKIRSEKAMDALRAAMEHEDARVRREVLSALAALRTEEAERLLIQCLDDPDVDNRKHATDWLANIGAVQAVPALQDLLTRRPKELRKHREWGVSTIKALGKLGGEDAAEALRAYLKQDNRLLALFWKNPLTAACREAIAEIEKRVARGARE